MKIIVNADDMGYTRGVSAGIIEGYRKGIVTSTTVMCHMPQAEEAAPMAQACTGTWGWRAFNADLRTAADFGFHTCESRWDIYEEYAVLQSSCGHG